MSKKKTEEALRRELEKLMPITAWRQEGSVHLFGRYRIDGVTGGYAVTKLGDEQAVFKTRRAATVWCTADICGDRRLSAHVKVIDRMLDLARTDIALRSSLPGSDEFKEIVGTKLEHKLQKRTELENEMDRCVRLAKQYQRGIANETIRVCST